MSPQHLFRDLSEHDQVGRKPWVWVVYFSLVFLLVCYLTRLILPASAQYRAGEVMQEKLSRLDVAGQQYNLFFLGTSHVYRSIDPSVIDRVLASENLNYKSYNAGVFRLGTLQADLLVNQIINSQPDGQQFWVVIEPSILDFDYTNWSSERELYLHDTVGTKHAISFHWRGILDKESLFLRARHLFAALCHLRTGLLNWCNYGRASNYVFAGASKLERRSHQSPPENGFLPLDEDFQKEDRRGRVDGKLDTEEFLDGIEPAFDKRVSWQRPPMGSTCRFYADLCERIEAAGGKVVFVSTPRIGLGVPRYGDDIESLFKHPPEFVKERLLADFRFGSADANSGAFSPIYWYDPEHLNKAGSEKFSIDLGRKLTTIFSTTNN